MTDKDNGQELEATRSRREFLKKAGKYAIYTPPAVMLLMKPSQATFCGSGCGSRGRVSWMKSSGGMNRMGGRMNSSGGWNSSGGDRVSYFRMMVRRWMRPG